MKSEKLLMNNMLNFIFPPTCINCGEVGSYICNLCIRTKIKFNFAQKCHICGGEVNLGMVHKECGEQSYLDGIIFACYYNTLAKKAIREVKYKGLYRILDDITRIILIQLRQYKFSEHFILTPVPLHRSRMWKRGFNQTEILSKNIAQHLKGSIFIKDLLIRQKKTKTQVGLHKFDRAVNLKEAFKLNPKLQIPNSKIENLKIYLIDDVYTTGATLNECAKVLKEAGFKNVYGICFAKSRV